MKIYINQKGLIEKVEEAGLISGSWGKNYIDFYYQDDEISFVALNGIRQDSFEIKNLFIDREKRMLDTENNLYFWRYEVVENDPLISVAGQLQLSANFVKLDNEFNKEYVVASVTYTTKVLKSVGSNSEEEYDAFLQTLVAYREEVMKAVENTSRLADTQAEQFTMLQGHDAKITTLENRATSIEDQIKNLDNLGAIKEIKELQVNEEMINATFETLEVGIYLAKVKAIDTYEKEIWIKTDNVQRRISSSIDKIYTGDKWEKLYIRQTELLENGKIKNEYIPALSITSTKVFDKEEDILTWAEAEEGDVAIVNGVGSFILSGSDPSVIGNWKILSTPTDAVKSVNGKTGDVTLTLVDIPDVEDFKETVIEESVEQAKAEIGSGVEGVYRTFYIGANAIEEIDKDLNTIGIYDTPIEDIEGKYQNNTVYSTLSGYINNIVWGKGVIYFKSFKVSFNHDVYDVAEEGTLKSKLFAYITYNAPFTIDEILSFNIEHICDANFQTMVIEVFTQSREVPLTPCIYRLQAVENNTTGWERVSEKVEIIRIENHLNSDNQIPMYMYNQILAKPDRYILIYNNHILNYIETTDGVLTYNTSYVVADNSSAYEHIFQIEDDGSFYKSDSQTIEIPGQKVIDIDSYVHSGSKIPSDMYIEEDSILLAVIENTPMMFTYKTATGYVKSFYGSAVSANSTNELIICEVYYDTNTRIITEQHSIISLGGSVDTYTKEEIDSLIESVEEVAAGRVKGYVFGLDKAPQFDTQDDVVNIYLSETRTLEDVNGETIDLVYLQIADSVYITNTDVPDRWVAGKTDSVISFRKLETQKVEVTSAESKPIHIILDDYYVSGTSSLYTYKLPNDLRASIISNPKDYILISNKFITLFVYDTEADVVAGTIRFSASRVFNDYPNVGIIKYYFNLPTTDKEFYIYENKKNFYTDYQAKLLSGSTIKTVAGQSIMGSGDIPFKTINGQSIQGSGDITFSGGTSAESKPIHIILDDYLSGTKLTNMPTELWTEVYNNPKDYAFIYNKEGILLTYDSSHSGSSYKKYVGFKCLGSNWNSEFFISNFTIHIATSPEESYIVSETVEYQKKLVSGTDIKTLNGQSLLGPGDITISGGSDTDSEYSTITMVVENEQVLTAEETAAILIGKERVLLICNGILHNMYVEMEGTIVFAGFSAYYAMDTGTADEPKLTTYMSAIMIQLDETNTIGTVVQQLVEVPTYSSAQVDEKLAGLGEKWYDSEKDKPYPISSSDTDKLYIIIRSDVIAHPDMVVSDPDYVFMTKMNKFGEKVDMSLTWNGVSFVLKDQNDKEELYSLEHYKGDIYMIDYSTFDLYEYIVPKTGAYCNLVETIKQKVDYINYTINEPYLPKGYEKINSDYTITGSPANDTEADELYIKVGFIAPGTDVQLSTDTQLPLYLYRVVDPEAVGYDYALSVAPLGASGFNSYSSDDLIDGCIIPAKIPSAMSGMVIKPPASSLIQDTYIVRKVEDPYKVTRIDVGADCSYEDDGITGERTYTVDLRKKGLYRISLDTIQNVEGNANNARVNIYFGYSKSFNNIGKFIVNDSLYQNFTDAPGLSQGGWSSGYEGNEAFLSIYHTSVIYYIEVTDDRVHIQFENEI